MKKIQGKILSGALATALTVANMGALMPMTALASSGATLTINGNNVLELTKESYTGAGTASLVYTEITGMNSAFVEPDVTVTYDDATTTEVEKEDVTNKFTVGAWNSDELVGTGSIGYPAGLTAGTYTITASADEGNDPDGQIDDTEKSSVTITVRNQSISQSTITHTLEKSQVAKEGTTKLTFAADGLPDENGKVKAVITGSSSIESDGTGFGTSDSITKEKEYTGSNYAITSSEQTISIDADEYSGTLTISYYYAAKGENEDWVYDDTAFLTDTIYVAASNVKSVDTLTADSDLGTIDPSTDTDYKKVKIRSTATLYEKSTDQDEVAFAIVDSDTWDDYEIEVAEYELLVDSAKTNVESASAALEALEVDLTSEEYVDALKAYNEAVVDYATALADKPAYEGTLWVDNVSYGTTTDKFAGVAGYTKDVFTLTDYSQAGASGTAYKDIMNLDIAATAKAGDYYIVGFASDDMTNICKDKISFKIAGVGETDEQILSAIGIKLEDDDTAEDVKNQTTLVEIYEGEEAQLYGVYVDGYTSTTTPVADSWDFVTDETLSHVTWSSSNEDAVTVSSDGIIKGVAATNATTTITATYENGTSKFAKAFTVTKVSAADVTVTDADKGLNAIKGVGEQLVATYNDDTDVTSESTFKVYASASGSALSSNASVDNSGIFTATKTGTYYVTATYNGIESERVAIAVSDKTLAVDLVGKDSTGNVNGTTWSNVNIGDTFKYAAYLNGVEVTENATFTSSNSKIVSVSDDNTLKAVAAGTATITVSHEDTTSTQTISITVIADSYTIKYYEGETLTESAPTLYVGEERQLLLYNGKNLVESEYTFVSSDPLLVSVDDNGVITAVKSGTATISVIDADKKVISGVTLAVTVKEADVNFKDNDGKSITTLSLAVSESATVSVFYGTKEISDGAWTTVPANVKVSGNTITGSSVDSSQTLTYTYNGQTGSITVTTTSLNISLEADSDQVLAGETVQLTIMSGNSEIADDTAFTFESDDTDIATVNDYGVVTGKKEGTATIYLKNASGYVKPDGTTTTTESEKVKVSISVVSEITATAITLNPSTQTYSLAKGDTTTIEATLTPSNSTDEITWTSDDETVATVVDGTITAVGEGSATITIRANSTLYKTVKVNVTESEEQAAAAQAAYDAADKAIAAAKAAEANPTAETVKAAQDAAAAATAAAKAAAEVGENEAAKEAEAAAKTATDAATTAQAKIDEAAKKAEEQKAAAEKAAAQATGATGTDSASGNAYKVTDGSSKTVAITKASSSASGKVTIPSTVTISGDKFTVTEISANAFKGNKKIKQVVIPKTVTKIGKNAFKNCSKVTKITIKANKNLTVGKNAFKGLKDGSKIVVKGVSGSAKKKLVKKIKKQVTSSRTTVK